MKHAGNSMEQISLSSPVNSAGRQSFPSSSGLDQARSLSAKQPKGKVKLGSESRHASLRVLQLVAYASQTPGSSFMQQGIPSRYQVGLLIQYLKYIGKYMANCKYSIVSVSDDYMVTCAAVGDLNLSDRFCPIGSQGFHEARPEERSPE